MLEESVDSDDNDDQHRVFQLTEEPPIAHAVAPITVFVAAQGFVEGGGIGRVADAFIQIVANFRNRGGPEVAEVAQRRRFNLLAPAHATPSLR